MNECPCEDWLEELSHPMAEEALALVRGLRERVERAEKPIGPGDLVKVELGAGEVEAYVQHMQYTIRDLDTGHISAVIARRQMEVEVTLISASEF